MRRVLQSSAISSVGFLAVGLTRLAALVFIGRTSSSSVFASMNAAIGLAMFASLLLHVPLGTLFGRSAPEQRGGGQLDPFSRLALFAAPILSGIVFGIALLPLHLPVEAATFSAALTLTYGIYIYARYATFALGMIGRTILGELGVSLLLLLSGGAALLHQDILSLGLFAASFGVFVAIALPKLFVVSRISSSMAASLNYRSLWTTSLSVLSTNGPTQLLVVLLTALPSAIEGSLSAAAFTLATPMSMLGQAIAPVLIPHAAELDRNASRVKITQPMLALAAVMVVTGGAVAGLAPWLLELFFGSQFQPATPTLVLLAIGMTVFNLSLLISAVLLAWRDPRSVVATQLTGGFVFLALGAVGAAFLPVREAVPIAYIFGISLATVTMSASLVKHIRRDYAERLRDAATQ